MSLGRSTLVGPLACGWWQTGGEMQGPVCYVYVSSRKAVCLAVHLMASEVSVSPNAGGMHLLCLLGQIWGFNWAEEQTVSEGWGPLIGIQIHEQGPVPQMTVWCVVY